MTWKFAYQLGCQSGGDVMPDLRLHLDASDTSNVYENAGSQPFGLGTTPIVSTGTNCGCWADLSGLNHHMNQDDAGRRCNWQENIQNGLGAMYCPGIDVPAQWKFYATASVLANTDAFTAMYVASIDANETEGIVWSPTNSGNPRVQAAIDSRNIQRAAGTLVDNTAGGTAAMPADIAGGAFHLITLVKSGDTITGYLDGVAGTPYSTGGNGVFANDYTRIFATIDDFGGFIGYLGELKIWGGALSASQLATEGDALKAKWATP